MAVCAPAGLNDKQEVINDKATSILFIRSVVLVAKLRRFSERDTKKCF
jgi:hypothetical protein